MPLTPGQNVLIRFNPHQSGVKDGPGTIVGLLPGTGLSGCDLALVRYRHPVSGRLTARPISLAFSSPLPQL
jgi:hypothetical protein